MHVKTTIDERGLVHESTREVVQTTLSVNIPATFKHGIEGSSAFITQDVWYIDSVDGDDSNDATSSSTAIKTLSELTRRLRGKTLSSNVTVMNIYLAGTFPTEPLILDLSVVSYCWIKISAETTITYTGSITEFTAYAAGSSHAALTDSAAAFVQADQAKRVRLTSGASEGSCSFVLKQMGGTQIRVADFYSQGTTGYGAGALTTSPSVSTTFVLETLTCQVGGIDIHIKGGIAALLVRDIEFTRSSPSITRSTLRTWTSALSVATKFFGCTFDTSGGNMGLTNSVCYFYSCCLKDTAGAFIITDSTIGCAGLVTMCANFNVAGGGTLTGVSLYQQGGVSGSSGRGTATVTKNGTMSLSSHWASYDVTSTDGGFVADDSAYVYHSSPGVYWSSGSTPTYGIRIRGVATMQYGVKPTVTGSTSETIIAGQNVPLASVPFYNTGSGCGLTLRA